MLKMGRIKMEVEKNNKDRLNIILVLSNYYDPSMPSWPEVMGIFGKEMQIRGHRVDWVMPYRVSTDKKPLMKKFCDADIYLIPFTNSNNLIIKLLTIPIYQIRLLLTLNKILHNERFDILIVRDDEISGLTALFIKKMWKIKFVINYSFPHLLGARDAYDGTIRSGLWLAYSKVLNILLNKILLPNADFIFPISSRMKEDFVDIGIAPDKMHPLPLGVDTTIFRENGLGDCSKRVGFNKNDFVFIYVGSLDRIRGLGILIDAMKIAIAGDKSIKLLFVGNGNHLNDMKKMVTESDMANNIVFTDRVPFCDVPKYLQFANAALSIINPLECFRVCSPCKLFEYMAMKKPLIANLEIPEHVEVVRSSQCGVLVEYSDKSIADAIIRMVKLYRDNSLEFNNMGTNGYQWVISNRTFDILSEDVVYKCKQTVNKCDSKFF